MDLGILEITDNITGLPVSKLFGNY